MKKIGGVCEVVCLLVVCFVWGFASEATAQNRSAFSPWLGMQNSRSGSLPNYQAFVRPQMDMLKELQDQSTMLKQQDSIQKDMSRILEAPREKPSMSGSQPSGFRQYLHYYQGLPQGGVPYYSGSRGARR
jgi:hypothetical protein